MSLSFVFELGWSSFGGCELVLLSYQHQVSAITNLLWEKIDFPIDEHKQTHVQNQIKSNVGKTVNTIFSYMLVNLVHNHIIRIIKEHAWLRCYGVWAYNIAYVVCVQNVNPPPKCLAASNQFSWQPIIMGNSASSTLACYRKA